MKKKPKSGHPRPMRGKRILLTPDMAKQLHTHPYTVTPSEREGVFINGFKCGACQVEFNVYSWKQDRHRVGTVSCPECGNRERFMHWRVTVNEAPRMTLDASAEIYKLAHHPGSQMMDDSNF